MHSATSCHPSKATLPLAQSRRTPERHAAAAAASRAFRLRCHAEAPKAQVERTAPSASSGAAATPTKPAELEAARQHAELLLDTHKYSKASEPQKLDTIGALRHKLEVVSRELGAASEAEYARLATRDRASAAIAPTPLLKLSVESLVREVQQQHQAAVQQAPADVRPNIVPLPLPPLDKDRLKGVEADKIRPEGDGQEILLQGFNWDSWKQPGGWYNHVRARAEELASLGFSTIWLPPPTQSVSEQGYMPGDLYNLNSKYGSEAELIACVKALQAAGFKVLGDAVLNHRCAQHQDSNGIWNKYGGRLAWDQRAIVGDDPNFRGRGNRSSGDIFSAAPNIDHSQDFVKRDLQEWMIWLRTHAGFDGWRLDFVKGFHGSHVKDYMEATVPQFAVGEYWDALAYEWDGTPCHNQDAHRQRTINWINAAGGLSTAFDITTKGIMHAVFERCEYWRLRDGAGKPPGLLGWWPSRAVTFLENHDTGSSQGHWRFPNHALEQGYAYLLTHPGTPSVFWDHLADQRLRDTIGRLVAIRKRNGIHCRSTVKIVRADRDVYAADIDGKLLIKIGPGDFTPNRRDPAIGGVKQWLIADCGHNWSVWERNPAASVLSDEEQEQQEQEQQKQEQQKQEQKQ